MTLQITKPGIDLGIVTTNGDALLAFYRDVLGLDHQGDMPMPGGAGTMHRLLCGGSLIKLVAMPSLPTTAPPGGRAAWAFCRSMRLVSRSQSWRMWPKRRTSARGRSSVKKLPPAKATRSVRPQAAM